MSDGDLINAGGAQDSSQLASLLKQNLGKIPGFGAPDQQLVDMEWDSSAIEEGGVAPQSAHYQEIWGKDVIGPVELPQLLLLQNLPEFGKPDIGELPPVGKLVQIDTKLHVEGIHSEHKLFSIENAWAFVQIALLIYTRSLMEQAREAREKSRVYDYMASEIGKAQAEAIFAKGQAEGAMHDKMANAYKAQMIVSIIAAILAFASAGAGGLALGLQKAVSLTVINTLLAVMDVLAAASSVGSIGASASGLAMSLIQAEAVMAIARLEAAAMLDQYYSQLFKRAAEHAERVAQEAVSALQHVRQTRDHISKVMTRAYVIN